MNLHTRCFSCGGGDLSIFYEIKGIPVHSVLLMPTREKATAYPRGDLKLGDTGSGSGGAIYSLTPAGGACPTDEERVCIDDPLIVSQWVGVRGFLQMADGNAIYSQTAGDTACGSATTEDLCLKDDVEVTGTLMVHGGVPCCGPPVCLARPHCA